MIRIMYYITLETRLGYIGYHMFVLYLGDDQFIEDDKKKIHRDEIQVIS
jgi:hypothetical protein